MDGGPYRPSTARYVVNTQKAVEVILWLATAKPGVDIYHVVKCAFFADKDHLNRYGRPVTGDHYEADVYGPKGKCVWGLLRREPEELLALDGNGPPPFQVQDNNGWIVEPERPANLRLLSKSDVECLQKALDEYGDLSFDELVELTHREPAYAAAEGGRIRYEDLLDRGDPLWAEKAADLAESAQHTVL